MNKYIIIAIGISIGAVAGFLYWNQIGCLTGNCSITSVWYNSTVYGALIGGLGASVFSDSKKKSQEKN
ncbi:MAG: hypothetical protein EA412_12145 [Chitinophagaceae bacterium]|jgi:uncharacterized protein YcfJ|nr:MAG: hypothetical protein EA412_12145 [Chitinophagaceae bacterium]